MPGTLPGAVRTIKEKDPCPAGARVLRPGCAIDQPYDVSERDGFRCSGGSVRRELRGRGGRVFRPGGQVKPGRLLLATLGGCGQISVCPRGSPRSARGRAAVQSQTPDPHILPAPAERRRRRGALDDETRAEDCTIPRLRPRGGRGATRASKAKLRIALNSQKADRTAGARPPAGPRPVPRGGGRDRPPLAPLPGQGARPARGGARPGAPAPPAPPPPGRRAA